MSFEFPPHAKLIEARAALAAVLAQAIVVDRHVEYEGDDQGGVHAIHGYAVSLATAAQDEQPLVVFERTGVHSLRYYSDRDRASLAAMLGCTPAQLMESPKAPVFFSALENVGFGLMLSCLHLPYEIAPAKASG